MKRFLSFLLVFLCLGFSQQPSTVEVFGKEAFVRSGQLGKFHYDRAGVYLSSSQVLLDISQTRGAGLNFADQGYCQAEIVFSGELAKPDGNAGAWFLGQDGEYFELGVEWCQWGDENASDWQLNIFNRDLKNPQLEDVVKRFGGSFKRHRISLDYLPHLCRAKVEGQRRDGRWVVIAFREWRRQNPPGATLRVHYAWWGEPPQDRKDARLYVEGVTFKKYEPLSGQR